jgi:hypothetical protein
LLPVRSLNFFRLAAVKRHGTWVGSVGMHPDRGNLWGSDLGTKSSDNMRKGKDSPCYCKGYTPRM